MQTKKIFQISIRRVGGVPEGGRAVLPREAGAHPPDGRVQQAQDHPAAQEIDLLHCLLRYVVLNERIDFRN